MLAQSELFAGTPLDGTAIHRPAGTTAPHYQTKTGLRQTVATGENQNIAVGDTEVRGIKDGPELITAEKALIAGKGKRGRIWKR